MDNTLGWEFTNKVGWDSATITYAFRPEYSDSSPYDFAVLVSHDRSLSGLPDSVIVGLTKSVGVGIAMSKVLFERWNQNEQTEYKYRLNDNSEPSGISGSPPDFNELKGMLLKGLLEPYEKGDWVDYDPRGVAVDLGITTALARTAVEDLRDGGEIGVKTTGDYLSLRMTRQGADALANTSPVSADSPHYPVPETIDVFLSHSAVDDTLCRKVAEILALWDITSFHTPVDTPTGYWHPQIETALRSSAHVAVILTPAAANQSIWVHQEFGYFLGFKSAVVGPESQHRVHYFHEPDLPRLGMYGQIQGNEVENLSEPLAVAREIARAIGKTPGTEDVGELAIPVLSTGAQGQLPPRSEEYVRKGFTASSNPPDYTELRARLELVPPVRIFRVGVAGWATNLEIIDTSSSSQVQPGERGSFDYTVQHNPKAVERPSLLRDHHGREFPYSRPMDPGDQFEPLYLTFQLSDESCWAAVLYFESGRHPKGYPQLELEEGGAIYGWIRGEVGGTERA